MKNIFKFLSRRVVGLLVLSIALGVFGVYKHNQYCKQLDNDLYHKRQDKMRKAFEACSTPPLNFMCPHELMKYYNSLRDEDVIYLKDRGCRVD